MSVKDKGRWYQAVLAATGQTFEEVEAERSGSSSIATTSS
jgi:hypothetical protein